MNLIRSSRVHLFFPGRVLTFLVGALVAGLLAAGCKQTDGAHNSPPEDALVTEEVTVSAAVQALNVGARLITLRLEDGGSVVVQAGPEVRNFDQIAVGDSVVVTYFESLAASVKKPDEVVQPPSATVIAGTAEAGAKPGVAIGQQFTVTVRIESVDLERSIVTFTSPQGGLRATHVVRPEGKEFIKGLKPGDQVEITYSEALAISIEEQ